MKVRYYRSLDRGVQFFGVKGRYVLPVAVGAFASLCLGFLVGGIVGVVLFVVGFFATVAGVIILQGRIGERELARRLAMSGLPRCLRTSPMRRSMKGLFMPGNLKH